MIREFQAFFTLFRQGKEVANPQKWKNGQIKASAIAAILTSGAIIAGGFGYNLDLSDPVIQKAAEGVIAVGTIINAVATVVSSAKVGVKEKK